jgi:AcrR family transcriptional regulator
MLRDVRPAENPTSEGRFQSPEVRRRQILDAAARLAVDVGLENTSIAKVAEAAGIAKGSIYLHYESRHDLLAGLQADLWRQMLERPGEIIADVELTSAAKLDAVVEHWMRFEFDRHDLYHAVFHTVATDSDEPLVEARGLLGQLIEGGMAAGEFDLDGLDPDVVLEFLLHAYIGPCFHHTDPEKAVVNVQELFRRTVGATP